MTRSTLTTTACALLFSASAQVNNNDNFWQQRSSTVSGGLELGVPLGEFEHTWGSTVYGISANIAMPMRNLPLEFGYDFSWGRMGSEYSTPRASGGLLSAVQQQSVDVKCNIYGHHALARLNPLRGNIRPYGEVMLGARNFVTRSTVTTEEGVTGDERDGSWVASSGWAVGLMYGIGRQVFLEGRVERLFNGKVDYVDPRTIEIASDGGVSYEKLNSRTESLQIQVGIGLRF
ncbi:MAG TPA: hypothetical protein PLL57_02045 [Flavobacteriales bacterium]|nr:hypothetical protein [Flavobacteriales bacterium]